MIKVTESGPQTEKNSVFSLIHLEVQKTRFHTAAADSWIVVGKNTEGGKLFIGMHMWKNSNYHRHICWSLYVI